MVGGFTAADLLDAVRFPAIDFLEGTSFFRVVRRGDGLSLIAPPCGCLLATAGFAPVDFCPKLSLDAEVRVLVLIFFTLGSGATVLAFRVAGPVGPVFLGVCLTVAGEILALKIFDFSSGALFFSPFDACDPVAITFLATNNFC